jgi:pimeloyl-ACP methyl ester carboxylesterase
MRYLYLHGFASDSASHKGAWFRTALAAHGVRLEVPDLNGDDFAGMTLTRQAGVVAGVLGDDAGPVTLIGSSFGGCLAALVAESDPRVARLVLLAPAFGFDRLLRRTLGDEVLARWRAEGRLRLPAEIDSRQRWLGYGLVEDLDRHPLSTQARELPARLFHGLEDATVPYEESVGYLRRNRAAQLVMQNDEHSLTASLPAIWVHLVPFLELPPVA